VKTSYVLGFIGAIGLSFFFVLRSAEMGSVSGEKVPTVKVSNHSKIPKIRRSKSGLEFEHQTGHQTAPVDSVREWDELMARLKETEACFENDTCKYNRGDPRAYGIEVGKNLAKQLRHLSDRIKFLHINDSEISKLARHFLSYQDGRIKGAALDLLLSQPESEDNMHSILEHVISYHDGLLISQALKGLAGYLNGKNDELIHQALEKALSSGGHFSSQSLALQMRSFVTRESIVRYRRLLARWPNSHPLRGLLQKQLDEAQRQWTGA
jgi:hypothetical protein